MKGYTKALCRDNSEITITCKCGADNVLKTKDVFNDPLFYFECKECGAYIEVDSSDLEDQLKEMFNNVGIHLT